MIFVYTSRASVARGLAWCYGSVTILRVTSFSCTFNIYTIYPRLTSVFSRVILDVPYMYLAYFATVHHVNTCLWIRAEVNWMQVFQSFHQRDNRACESIQESVYDRSKCSVYIRCTSVWSPSNLQADAVFSTAMCTSNVSEMFKNDKIIVKTGLAWCPNPDPMVQLL